MADWIKVQETGDGKTWDFEKNSKIEGVLLNIKNDVGPNGSKLYEIEVGNDVFGVWGSFVLDAKLSKVEVGNEVMIEYKGKAVSEKTKRTYKNYDVAFRPIETAKEINIKDLPY